MQAGDDQDQLLRTPRRTRLAAFVGAALLQIVVVFGLVRAFAPQFAEQAMKAVVSTFSVTVTTPPPQPEPAKEIDAAGAAGEAGRKAVARAENAPPPKVPIAAKPAPRAARTGDANSSGAKDVGEGTGAAGAGLGTGNGNDGNGQGGGLTRKAEKISGTIAEKDYNKANRALRLGNSVTIAITVGADGKPTGCRVVRRSPDPEADALTCRLAVERFRFRPATDTQGNPVASVYGWQQRWFY
ncbi:TonB family protein [Novosphingobium sp.]|uniref:TonB family protein n=1 Tax=Novosphingobium sp. TaxID=1874826 RepID=UPI0035B0A763